MDDSVNENQSKTEDKGKRQVAKRLDPSRFIAGAVAAIAAFLLQLLVIPPVVNPQVETLESYLIKGGAAVIVFLITLLLREERRTVARVFVLSLATIIVISFIGSAGLFFLSVRDALGVHQRVASWTEVLNDTFHQYQYFTTNGTDVNGSGNATAGGGLLTLRLRSTHVANQQFFVTNLAPLSQGYYVETSVRRQSGPIGSGCFLAFGVLDSNRYFLFEVTDDQRPDRPLHSAQIFQELRAAPAVERAVDQTSSLPYVDHWSLLWPPGADSGWTHLAIYRLGNDYDFFVNERLVSRVTNLPVPNSRITVGAFDPGTQNGSYVNCEFQYLRAWRY
jgi:hypothetical protein